MIDFETLTVNSFLDEAGRGLLEEAFTKAGVTDHSQPFYINFECIEVEDRTSVVMQNEGLIAFVDPDDFRLAVYKDSEPLFAFYTSTRGNLHQDGLFIVEGNQFFYAHNLPKICGRSENIDAWEQANVNTDFCCAIAQEWLLGRRDV